MRRVLTPLLLTVLFAPGCASWTRGHAQAAAEGALVGLNNEGALLAAQLSRPEVRAAAQALAEAVALGATSALTDPEREALVTARAAALVDALAPAFAEALKTELGPTIRAEWSAAIRDGVQALTQDPSRQDLLGFVLTLERATVDTLGPRLRAQAAAGLTDDLGPAAAVVLETQLAPALARALTDSLAPAARVTMAEQLNPALVELTRASTRAMLEEVAAAMRGELGAAIREDRQTWFNAFQEEADAFARAMGALAAVLGVGLLGVIIAWRRASTQGAERLAAVELLTAAIKEEVLRDPTQTELVRRVRELGRGTPAGDTLRGILNERRHLKVELPAEPNPAPDPPGDRP